MAMVDELGDSSYKQVQGLTRGLAVLRALTASANGRAQISEISAATKLHRTTVRRLLETLGVEGFVERSGDDGAFQLTQEIKRLADNFSVFDHVAAAAAEVLRDLTAEVAWPCSLATPYEHMMEIRAATHHLSPLSFHRGVIGRRLPMLLTSMGRAYLAFSSDVVRERTLDLIAARYELGEVPLMSLSTFRQILARTQEDGYGSTSATGRPTRRSRRSPCPSEANETPSSPASTSLPLPAPPSRSNLRLNTGAIARSRQRIEKAL